MLEFHHRHAVPLEGFEDPLGVLEQLRIQPDAFGEYRHSARRRLLTESPVGEGRAKSSPVHQNEDSPSIAGNVFLDQGTGNDGVDSPKRVVELRGGADIVDRASRPPLAPVQEPRDTRLDDRGKPNVVDRALEVGRTTQDHGPRNGNRRFCGERRQGAFVVGGLNGLVVREG